MEIKEYEHHVKYYETDRMGIVHHSNYIRWMEEARVDMLEKIGMSYRAIEDAGIISPVLSVNCEYRRMTDFDDRILIRTGLKEYNGFRFTIHYEMRNAATGEVCCTGETKHCFLTAAGKPMKLNRVNAEWDATLKALNEAFGQQ